MQFGLFHLFEATDGRPEVEMVGEQLDLMQAADDLGYASVWAAEHHFSNYGICPSSALALAAVARVTKRVRLGTGIVVLPFHNPIRAAEELAFVDLVSNGRLDVGFGRGYRPRELAAFGVDPADTRSIANEAMTIIHQAWTQDEVHFRGKHFQVDGVPVRPKPLQKPHPPTYVGSLSPETFELVGKLGANLLFTPTFSEAENVPAQIAAYRDAVAKLGLDPAAQRIGALRMVYVAESGAQARAEFEPAVQRFFAESAALDAPPGTTAGAAAPANLDALIANGNVIAGDPAEVLAELEAMQREWQLTDLLLWTRVGALGSDKVLRSMELFAKHVMPRLSGDAA